MNQWIIPPTSLRKEYVIIFLVFFQDNLDRAPTWQIPGNGREEGAVAKGVEGREISLPSLWKRTARLSELLENLIWRKNVMHSCLNLSSGNIHMKALA